MPQAVHLYSYNFGLRYVSATSRIEAAATLLEEYGEKMPVERVDDEEIIEMVDPNTDDVYEMTAGKVAELHRPSESRSGIVPQA